MRRRLSYRARRLARRFPTALWALIVNSALMNTGFFMLQPLLAIHFISTLGLDAATAGLVLAARQFVQQGLAPFAGALADRLGYKPVLVGGMVVRALGFALFAVGDTLLLLFAAAVISALGGSFFDPASRSGVVAVTPERDRQRAFAAQSSAAWLGVTVGPLVGALLVRWEFRLVGFAAAACFLVGGLLTFLLLPGDRSTVKQAQPLGKLLATVVHDRPFLVFSALLAGYYFLVVQFFIAVPLRVSALTGDAANIGLVLVTNALVALGLQYPLASWAARHLPPFTTLAIGVALVGIGFAGYGWAPGLPLLLLMTALISTGQVLVSPTMATVTARMAGGAGTASYFGFGALALAVGGAAGNFSGGYLVDLGGRLSQPTLPWLCFGLLGLASAAGLQLFGLRYRLPPPRPA